ncbi:Ig-like domain-containing protein [Microbulbifer sp.]|uniref:Ig-like domain-containing protein n=1 Tax=Microbulbifer sp. TaxID=1908541 RepID=UPI003F417B73
MHSAFNKRLSAFLPILFMSACGGGGGSSSDGGAPYTSSNRAPEFISASEITSEENNSDTLLTLSASDADGDNIIFSVIGGEDQSRFLIDNGNQLRFGFAPDFENPADLDGDNIYQVTVEASDGKGGTASQAVVITILDINDGAPEFTSSTEITVQEGVRGVFYTAAAQDPDRDDVAYSLSDGADSGLFSVDSVSGDLRFNDAPDFGSPADSDEDNLYQLIISAADNEGAANQLSLEVTVTEQTSPSVRIDFPTGGANMGGKLSGIALTARAVDLESGKDASDQLASITVDSQSPVQDSSSEALWYLDTSLGEGRDAYRLSAQFVTGDGVDYSHSVINEQLIEMAIGVSYDNFYGTHYFADRYLGTIFEVGSSRRVISGPTVGSGPALKPIDMEQNFPLVRSDPSNDKFVVLNKDGSIVSVQRTTGDRTLLIDPHCSPCESLPKRREITLDSTGTIAYSTLAKFDLPYYGEIYRYNLSTGDSELISSSDPSLPKGKGPDLSVPSGIVLDEGNGQLYVIDISTSSIVRVDIASGDRTTISGNGVGNGERLSGHYIVGDFDNGKIYAPGYEDFDIQKVHQVDIETGNRSVVVNWATGQGPLVGYHSSIGREPANDRLLLASYLNSDAAVISLDIDTGDYSVISSNRVGRGPSGPSYNWSDLSYSSSTDRLLAVSQNDNAVAGIDLQNGDRTIVSDFDPGASPRVVASTIVADESGRHAYIFDEYSDRLTRIDLESGELAVISATGIGEGPAFFGLVQAMELDANNNRIVLLQASGLMTVDLDTGDREIIFDNHTGSGPFFDSVDGLALDLANNRAFVSDDGTGGVWQVDLTSGDRSTFASSVHGGTADQAPIDLVLDTLGNRLLVGTESGNLVAIDLEDFSQSTLSSGSDCDGASPSDCHGVPVAAFSSMTIDRAGNRLFAYDGDLDGLGGIVVVDLRSGQRALASK